MPGLHTSTGAPPVALVTLCGESPSAKKDSRHFFLLAGNQRHSPLYMPAPARARVDADNNFSDMDIPPHVS